MRPRTYIILPGEKYNYLTTVKEIKDEKGRTMWECKCDCGNTTTVSVTSLKTGKTKSCGCFRKKAANNRAKKAKTYGYTHHRLYACYYRIRRRCERKSDPSYNRYGGRGIKMCDEWKNDIMAFITWGIENGYKEGLSIDRIDNDGDYSPDNCRWADAMQQSNNRSTNKLVTYKGETHTVAEWSRIVGIRQLTLNARLVSGWTVEDALTVSTEERRYGILQDTNIKTVVYSGKTLIGIFNSQTEAAKRCGVSKSSVSACMRGDRSGCHGYTFKRYEEVIT